MNTFASGNKSTVRAGEGEPWTESILASHADDSALSQRPSIKCRDWTTEERAAWHWSWGSLDSNQNYESTLAWMLIRWRVDPVMFAVECLRVTLHPYQAQILLDLADAPLELYNFYNLDWTYPKRQVLVPSGHGLGKTRVLAIGIIWHLITHMFSKTLCTAPTSDQLTGQLWGEIRKMFRRMKKHYPELANDWEILNSSINHVDPDNADWHVIARTARPEKPEGLQGAHALDDDDAFGQLADLFGEERDNGLSGGILVIAEEASGVPNEIREVLEGALSEEGARFLAPGNPTRPDGWFAEDLEKTNRYAVHNLDCRISDRTKIYELPYRRYDGHIEYLKIRGFVRPEYWEDILTDVDHDEDSDRFRVRVRGLKPRSAFDQVIKANWVDEAIARPPHENSSVDEIVIGLDFGLTSDKHAKAVRQGFNIRDLEEWLPRAKPEEITLDAMDRAIDAVKTYHIPGKRIFIIGDSNGVGRGAMESLHRWADEEENKKYRVTVIHYNSGKQALDSKRFYRRRDEMWYIKGRAFLSDPRTSLPNVPGLKRQFTAPGYHEDTSRKIKVETKHDIKKRTGQDSGNGADAILQTLLVNILQEKPKPKKEDTLPKIFREHLNRLNQFKTRQDYIR